MPVMNLNDFISELAKLSIKLSNDQLSQLNTYCTFLLEYNEHTNLTAIRNREDVYLKHFYDSLTLIKIIDLNKINSLLDIGTGAGFPGMVLKIIYPDLDVTLLDSNNKKTTFLNLLATKLQIKVTIINNRAEEYIENNRNQFDIVVSRAVAKLNILTELSLPFLKINGQFIAMKSHANEELKDSIKAIKECGGKLTNQFNFILPFELAERTLIVITKVQPTNSKYPRRYEQILKKPL